LLALVGAALFAYTLLRPPSRAPAPPVFHTATPSTTEREAAKEAEARVRQRVEAEAPRRRRAETPFEVEITEQELNDLIRGLPQVRQALDEARVSGLAVQFRPERVIATLNLDVTDTVRAPVTVEGTIRAENGELRYETHRVLVGSIPAPGPVRKALDAQLASAVRELNRSVRGRIQEVHVEDHRLRVRATAAPSESGTPSEPGTPSAPGASG
jgi:hypothetical protein